MPSDPDNASTNAGGTTSQNDAWERAQAALKKIAPNAPSFNHSMPAYPTNDTQCYQDMQAYMMQYYPWMARSPYAMPYAPPQQFQPSAEQPGSFMNPYFFYGRPMRPPRPPPPPSGFRPTSLPSQVSRLPNSSPARPATNIPTSSSFDQPPRPPVRQSFPQHNAKNNFLNRGSLGDSAPIRFNIGRPSTVSSTNALSGNVLQKATIPDNVRLVFNYLEKIFY